MASSGSAPPCRPERSSAYRHPERPHVVQSERDNLALTPQRTTANVRMTGLDRPLALLALSSAL